MYRNVLALCLALLLSSHTLAGAVVLVSGTGGTTGGGGGGGTGDVTTNTNISVDNELPLFSGITGKLFKRSTFTGVLKSTAGVVSVATPGTDYQAVLESPAVPHEFVTGFVAGSPLTARPAVTNLSDGTQVVTLTAPQIVENKQIVPRVCEFAASSGTITPNLDGCDKIYRHDVNGPVTMDVPTASGDNPRPMHALALSFKATTEQPIAWPPIYSDGYGVPLPTTIPSTRYLALLFRWNVTSAKYELWAGDPELGTTGGGGGSGDVTTNTSISVDGELPLFSGITGKIFRRAALTGVLKATSGVASVATPGSDYQAALTGGSGAPTTTCLYDGDSHKVCFAPADLTADHNVSLPDADSTTVIPVIEAPPTATYLSYIDPDGVQHSADFEAAGLTDYADLVRVTAVQKVTNKVLPPPAVLLSASSGTVTAPNTDLYEIFYRHDVVGALTIPNPTGTPDPFQSCWVCLKSAAPQTLTWGANYTAEFGYALPTATTGNGTRYDCWKYAYNPTSTKWGLIATSTTTTVMPATDGGTGFGSYTVGDLLYANTTTTLAKLAAGTNGHFLKSNGAGVAPSYAAATAAGTGTIPLNVGSAYYPTTDAAQPRVDEKRPAIRFDGSATQSTFWVSVIPADYTGSPVFYYVYSLVSATSGTHNMNISIMVLSNSTGDWLATDSFDTSVACNDAAVPGTAGQSHTISCALTTNDSMAAGKMFAVRMVRDVTDTNDGTSELLGAWIQYAR